MIKYGLISDYGFFQWLERNAASLLHRDEKALAYAIEHSCLNKAKIVSADETEQGIRAILNLGHTFGHAIETFQQYTGFLHGEAVAVGMVMAAELSRISGGVSQQDVDRARALIIAFSLPIAPPEAMQADDFMRLMVRDKKVLDGQLRLVLLERLGSAVVSADFRLQWLEEVLINACQN